MQIPIICVLLSASIALIRTQEYTFELPEGATLYEYEYIPDCNDTQFKCADNEFCVDRSELCDGVKQCKDGSDELAENCPTLIKKDECSTFTNINWRYCMPKFFRALGILPKNVV